MAINNKIKGITITLNGDTTNLQKAFKNVETDSTAISKQLTLINQKLKLDPGDVNAAAEKMNLLRQRAESSSEKLKKLKEVQSEIQQQYRDGVIDKEQWDAFNLELIKTENSLNRTYKQIEKIHNATNGAGSGMQSAAKSTKEWTDVLKGNLLSGVIRDGIQELTSTLTDFAKSAVQVGKDFDSAMSQVAATMGTTAETEDFKKLSDAAEKMGATTKYSAAQAAEALNYLALAGYSADEAVSALPTVLSLAQAGGMDLANASDMVTDSISALGLEQQHMSELTDKMAVAAQKSNTSVSQLGEAILTVGGTAKNIKGGITELNTMLGIIADNGVKGAEGGTALRNIILSLTAPTDEAAAALKELGVKVSDADGNMRSLPDIFKDINTALDEYRGNVSKTEMLNEIFNKVDLKSVNALLGTSSERFSELSEYIDNSVGAAQQMADTMNDNLEGSLLSVNSAAEAFEKNLYDRVSEPLKNTANSVADVLRNMTGDISEEDLKAAISEMGGYINDGLIEISEIIRDTSNTLIPTMLEGINAELPLISESASGIILNFAQGIINSLPLIFEGAENIIIGIADGVTAALPELTPAAVKSVMTIAQGLIDNIPLLIEAAVELLAALCEGIVNSAPELAKSASLLMIKLSAALIEAIPKLLEATPKIINAIADSITSVDWLETAKELTENINKALSDALTSAADSFKHLGKIIMECIFPKPGEDSGDFGGDYGDPIAESYKTTSEKITESGKNLVESMCKTSDDIMSAASGESEGITTKAEMLENALAELEHSYKIHDKTDEEYWAKRKEYIEQYRDESSEEWHKLNDEVIAHYEELAETERKAAETEAKEAADALKSKVESQIDTLDYLQSANGYDNDWYITEYEKILNSLDKSSALYQEHYIKLQKLRKSNEEQKKKEADDAKKTAVKNAENEIDAIYDKYEEKYKELEKLKDTAYKKFMSIGGDVFTFEKGENGTKQTIEDMRKQMKEMEGFYNDVKKLKDSGASQAMIDEIMAMSDEEAAAWADYLSDMNKSEFDGVNALYKKKEEYAKELADMLYSDNEAELSSGLKTELKAYYNGSEDANNYADEFIAALLERDADFKKTFDDILGGNISEIINGLGAVKLPSAGADSMIPYVKTPQTNAGDQQVKQTASAAPSANYDSIYILLIEIYNLLLDIYKNKGSGTIAVTTEIKLDGAIEAISKKVVKYIENNKNISGT